MTATSSDAIWRLHERTVERGCAPPLRDSFVEHLMRERRRAGQAPHRLPVLTLAAARARLAREHPEWAEAITLTYIEGQPVRAVAVQLDVCHRTVVVRRQAGVALLAQWC